MKKIKKRFNMLFFVCKRGFTLTEVLIVVVIIGVLATLALPMLVKTIEKAKVGEATSNLNLIRTGQKIYFLEHGFFSGGATGLDALNIENPNSQASRYFEYAITSEAAATGNFSATAVRGGGDVADAPDPYQGDEYIIHKEGVITGPLL
ncbi:type IV pilin protein [Candidatus Omnitrophota bacterium]